MPTEKLKNLPNSPLPAQHRRKLAEEPQLALNDFKILMREGRQQHNTGNFKTARNHFQAALQLVNQLIDLNPLQGNLQYLPLKIAASHNLSISLSSLGQLGNAQLVLEELHRVLLKLCLAPAVTKQLRITALGALDNSLFSLTSVMGLRGKVDQLYRVINETDQVAELAASQLLH